MTKAKLHIEVKQDGAHRLWSIIDPKRCPYRDRQLSLVLAEARARYGRITMPVYDVDANEWESELVADPRW